VLRAKNHLKGQHVLSMEGPGARMQSQGRAVLTGQPVLTVDEVLARIDAVTHDDVMTAVRRYYDPARWCAVCIGPRPGPFRAVTEGFEWEER
jgi:predicted Zn-dependent peptidase